MYKSAALKDKTIDSVLDSSGRSFHKTAPR